VTEPVTGPESGPLLPRLAWAVVVASVLLAVADAAVTAQYRPLFSAENFAEHAWPSVMLAAIGSVVMGALIVSRYPRHTVGWLLIAGGSVAAVSLSGEAYSLWLTDHGGPGGVGLGRFVGWFSILAGASWTVTTLTLIFLLAPDGRLPSRRWRPVAVVALAGLALYIASVFTVPPADMRLDPADQDYGLLTVVLSAVGILLTTAALVASGIALVLRLRRAAGVERQQLRWMATSAATVAAGLVIALVAPSSGPEETNLGNVPLYVSYLVFPVCTAVAVLRYRLFDLDLIISRALLLAIATGMVAGGYVVAVIVLGAAAGRGTDGFWPSLLATALVAMAFQPVRRRVVRLADRLAFGASATPYEALADFARRLGDSPDPTSLLPAVADAAGAAVNARRATVRLRVPGLPDEVARWPVAEPAGRGSPAAGDGVEFPVLDGDELLGSITVEMPPGRSLRAPDSSLLQDLADQAGIAFRNARLAAELAHQVAELDRRTGELLESRRRLISAADAERARLERSIAREVVPHLEPLPDALGTLSRSAADGLDPARLEPLLASATTALEELREITRGVFPAQLARSGLEPALRSLLGRLGTGSLTVAGSGVPRLDDRVEAAAYFCVAEAVPDLGPPLEVALHDLGDVLEVVVSGCDDGELSLAHLRDRVETADGTVSQDRADGMTVLRVRLPARIPTTVSR
jgi:hypothetical protein